MFMRDGTPSGLSTMSTGVPSAMYGMSSTGTMRGDHALVTVTAGHLVARLQAALDREVHLDHLEHARGESSPAVSLPSSPRSAFRTALRWPFEPLGDRLELRVRLLVLQADLEPLLTRQVVEIASSICVPALSFFGPPSAALPLEHAVARAGTGRPRECAAGRSSPCAPRSSSAFSIARARESCSTPSRVNTRTSITVPSMPGGTRSEVSFTSDAFSPKIARSSFSSGVSWVSPFGVTLPTRMSPARLPRR